MKDITDFESEIITVCSKYEKKMPHASLVGVLTVVAHIYMDAQLANFSDDQRVEKGHSPQPAETKK